MIESTQDDFYLCGIEEKDADSVGMRGISELQDDRESLKEPLQRTYKCTRDKTKQNNTCQIYNTEFLVKSS